MRKTTLLWLALAVFCGAVLFHTSQKVTDGRGRLAELQTEIRAEEESLRVLQAEWSYLNQPERLEKLSRQYLNLVPMTGRQFATAEDIGEAPAPEAAPAPAEKTAEAAEAPVQKTQRPVAKEPVKTQTVKKESVKKQDGPKIMRPSSFAAQSAPKPLAPRKTETVRTASPAAAPHRDFSDLIKSLGVQ